MKKVAGAQLKKIPVGTSSESRHIDSRKRYRVKIQGRWYEGCFSKQWFGWKFEDYGSSGLQLNLIDEVYEIVPPPRAGGPPFRGTAGRARPQGR